MQNLVSSVSIVTLALALQCLQTSAQEQGSCGVIGNSDETQGRPSGTEMFYLNTANPAPCSGTITSFRVCYYEPDDVRYNHNFRATYAVYRRRFLDKNNMYYERVSEMFTALRSKTNFDNNDDDSDFNCYNNVLGMRSTPPTVLAGDVLGACIFNPPDSFLSRRYPLDIVSQVNGDEEFLLQLGTTAGCSRDTIPNNISISDVVNISYRRLHLYANIENTDNELVTTDQELLPNTSNTQIAAGVIVTLLLLLVLGVAIVLVVVYLVKHRRVNLPFLTRTLKLSTRRAPNLMQLQQLDNATYGQGEGFENISTRIIGQHKEAPGNVMQSGQQENESELQSNLYESAHDYAILEQNEEIVLKTYSEHTYSPLIVDESKRAYEKLLEQNKQEDIYGRVDEYLKPASEENELYVQIKACGIRNIPSKHIKVNGHLGSGQFGMVKDGIWRNTTRSTQVAIKVLKEGSSEEDKVKFLQEAVIMAQFRHPNVVTLYGVVNTNETLMLVVELIQKGDLSCYLHTVRPDPGELPDSNMAKLLLGFSQQVALGMHYLSSKGFVHRDLAARNILVSKDNMCKIADFGMSRDLADETYYVSHGGVIPVKWTAPEAINFKKYSTASDVWSYGCLLYEIWSVGYKPFEGVGNLEVIRTVDSGKRLSPPPGCPRMIYHLMIKCWNPITTHRPSFRELLLKLTQSSEAVLSIPPEALNTHHLAGVLGAPLEAGENMYKDLRNTYLPGEGNY